MEAKKLSTPLAEQLYNEVSDYRKKLKSVGLGKTEWEDWVKENHPQYNTAEGGQLLYKFWYLSKSDLNLTRLLEKFVTEKKAA